MKVTNHHEPELTRPIAFSGLEVETLVLTAAGKSLGEIADELSIRENEINDIRTELITRVQAQNIFGVFDYIYENNIIQTLGLSVPYAL